MMSGYAGNKKIKTDVVKTIWVIQMIVVEDGGIFLNVLLPRQGYSCRMKNIKPTGSNIPNGGLPLDLTQHILWE